MGYPCKILVSYDITVTAIILKIRKIRKNSNFEYPNSAWSYQRPIMDHPCKISVPCDHCYGHDLQIFEKIGRIRSSKFEIRSSKFEYPNTAWSYPRPMGHPCKISVPWDHCCGRDLQIFKKFGKKSEKFEVWSSNIQIVHDLTQDLWIIHAKFQSPEITVAAVICKYSKNSEKFGKIRNLKFEVWISD